MFSPIASCRRPALLGCWCLFAVVIAQAKTGTGARQMTESVTFHGITDTLTGDNLKWKDGLKAAEAAFREAEEIYSEPGFDERANNWKLEDESDEGDKIYSRYIKYGKMISVKTELPMSPRDCINETWNGVGNLPVWNPNIAFAKYIAKPTDYVDVVSYGTEKVLIVSARDFVNCRLYRPIAGGGYLLVSRSFKTADLPEVDGIVRGELHVASVRFRQHPTIPDRSLVDVLMCLDLKGMLPKFSVNMLLPKLAMIDTLENRKHFEHLGEEKKKKSGQNA